MTASYPAREGLVWFREAYALFRTNFKTWLIRLVGFLIVLMLLGGGIGGVITLLDEIFHLQWSISTSLLAQVLTGPVVMTFWWIALRDLNDPPTPTKSVWRSALAPSLLWIMGPSLIAWLVAAVCRHAFPEPFGATSSRLILDALSLWPLLTMLTVGVWLDHLRQSTPLSWWAWRPWLDGWTLLRHDWKALLTAWLVPWASGTGMGLISLVAVATVCNLLGLTHGPSWIVDHPFLAIVCRILIMIGFMMITVVANLALVIGYTRIRSDAARTTPAPLPPVEFPPL